MVAGGCATDATATAQAPSVVSPWPTLTSSSLAPAPLPPPRAWLAWLEYPWAPPLLPQHDTVCGYGTSGSGVDVGGPWRVGASLFPADLARNGVNDAAGGLFRTSTPPKLYVLLRLLLLLLLLSFLLLLLLLLSSSSSSSSSSNDDVKYPPPPPPPTLISSSASSSTDVRSPSPPPPPPPRVCISNHPEDKSCSKLGRVHVLNDPAARTPSIPSSLTARTRCRGTPVHLHPTFTPASPRLVSAFSA